MPESEFIHALRNEDLTGLRACPKSDYHNHACLGYRLDVLKKQVGLDIPEPPEAFEDFESFVEYLVSALHPHIYSREGFEFSVDAAMKQAVHDGVTKLEFSIDAQIMGTYASVDELVASLKRIDSANPEISLGPEIGINRVWESDVVDRWVTPMIESGYFVSIDLYGNEKVGAPELFADLYRKAADKGMLRKAHAGEYQDAEFVRRSVEVLGLDEVQHGIAAAQSKDVMRWLEDRGTVLHICPTSNVVLKRVPSFREHPIRTLFDHGVSVTINSDDIMVFHQSVSEEYLELCRKGVFSAEELETIRLFGLALRPIKKR